jgi:hypothetical protein
MKHLYVPNKLYKLSKQICICVEQILKIVGTKKIVRIEKIIWTDVTNLYKENVNLFAH